jgi:hypothetical protein
MWEMSEEFVKQLQSCEQRIRNLSALWGKQQHHSQTEEEVAPQRKEDYSVGRGSFNQTQPIWIAMLERSWEPMPLLFLFSSSTLLIQYRCGSEGGSTFQSSTKCSAQGSCYVWEAQNGECSRRHSVHDRAFRKKFLSSCEPVKSSKLHASGIRLKFSEEATSVVKILQTDLG